MKRDILKETEVLARPNQTPMTGLLDWLQWAVDATLCVCGHRSDEHKSVIGPPVCQVCDECDEFRPTFYRDGER